MKLETWGITDAVLAGDHMAAACILFDHFKISGDLLQGADFEIFQSISIHEISVKINGVLFAWNLRNGISSFSCSSYCTPALPGSNLTVRVWIPAMGRP
jgi:hypothetical protein